MARNACIEDEVYAWGQGVERGALAEHAFADGRLKAPKPRNLTKREATALPLVAITGYFLLMLLASACSLRAQSPETKPSVENFSEYLFGDWAG